MNWMIGIGGLAFLAAAAPYVQKIRHPEQRTFAAYLLFVSVFVATALFLFNAFAWLAARFGFSQVIQEQPAAALVAVMLVFLPAFALGRWQASKPPLKRGPPN